MRTLALLATLVSTLATPAQIARYDVDDPERILQDVMGRHFSPYAPPIRAVDEEATALAALLRLGLKPVRIHPPRGAAPPP